MRQRLDNTEAVLKALLPTLDDLKQMMASRIHSAEEARTILTRASIVLTQMSKAVDTARQALAN